MNTVPPGGWQRDAGAAAGADHGADPLGKSVLRHPLRFKDRPAVGLERPPHPSTWATRIGGSPGLISRHSSPKGTLPQWRYGRPPPQWWTAHIQQQRSSKRLPIASSPEVTALKDAIKAALAKNLNRVVDTFRQWDADLSGKISKREFFDAGTTGLGIRAARATYDALFDECDVDGSGEIDYKELNQVLRRRASDPSHADQWSSGHWGKGGLGSNIPMSQETVDRESPPAYKVGSRQPPESTDGVTFPNFIPKFLSSLASKS